MTIVSNWWTVHSRPKDIHAPRFEVFKDSAGHWRFRERAANGKKTSTSGEAYASRWNAKRAAYAHAARIEGSTVWVTDEYGMTDE